MIVINNYNQPPKAEYEITLSLSIDELCYLRTALSYPATDTIPGQSSWPVNVSNFALELIDRLPYG